MKFTPPQGMDFNQWKELHERNGYDVLPPLESVWKVQSGSMIISCLSGGEEMTWFTHGKTHEQQDAFDATILSNLRREGKIA